MHQNAPFIPLNIKNRLPKQGGTPLLQPPPSRPAAARVGDALSAYSSKISFYSQTYLHPCLGLEPTSYLMLAWKNFIAFPLLVF